jgi:hypothetical protein
MDILSALELVYPMYKVLIRASRSLPLSARSLIIKCCQAQRWPSDDPATVLHKLLSRHPKVLLSFKGGNRIIDLIDYGSTFDLQLDNLSSPILLDIMRALPLDDSERHQATWDSWAKEIALSEGMHRTSRVNWRVFFDMSLSDSSLVSSDLPINPNNMRKIRLQLQVFRRKLINRTLYARATHKNMSRSTRREFERETGIDLTDVPIFGQDDWQRHYHDTGQMLEGCCEIRQKWYPSGAKPRTYFAQGGESYAKSRFLQDFFTDLADTFTPTNHVERLKPSRLVGSTVARDDPHFFIYDLSNFTSNCSEQREFCYAMASFFTDIPVRLLDERDGYVWADLGSLLYDYYDTCVEGPALSYERVPGFDSSHRTNHGIASLLGIFGNLMTCTVAHFFIVSHITQTWHEINVAGDDGIVAEDRLNNYDTHQAISLVGAYSRDKCFPGTDSAAISLKRPFSEYYPYCYLLTVIIPPTLVMVLSYLRAENVDPRYNFIGLDTMPWHKRLKVVSRDLLRFLDSAHRQTNIYVEDIKLVFRGFQKLVKRHLPFFDVKIPHIFPPWPMSPEDYDFTADPPAQLMALYASRPSTTVRRLGQVPDDPLSLINVGDEYVCNNSGRLKLLYTLGYLERYDEEDTVVDQYQLYLYYFAKFSRFKPLTDPVLYRFVVIRDVPLKYT